MTIALVSNGSSNQSDAGSGTGVARLRARFENAYGQAFAQHHIEPVTYYLQLNQQVQYSGWHPLGNLLLDASSAERLKPLMLAQPFIQHVEIYAGQKVDVDCDRFRSIPINHSMYSIPRWYFLLIAGATWDLSRPWLSVDPDRRFKGAVLVSRNPRLQSPFIRYDFMDRHADKIVFAGVRREFEDFRQQCPRRTQFYEATDFLELTQVLAGCAFFVGNQGLLYTLAEALNPAIARDQ